MLLKKQAPMMVKMNSHSKRSSVIFKQNRNLLFVFNIQTRVQGQVVYMFLLNKLCTAFQVDISQNKMNISFREEARLVARRKPLSCQLIFVLIISAFNLCCIYSETFQNTTVKPV